MNKSDIKIIQLKKQEAKDLKASQLILEFSGKSVNSSLINTIRRVSYGYVPTYAFCKQSIQIEQNESIFDNDVMRLRLSQMTYPNLKVPIVYLPEQYWKGVDYSDRKREKFPEDTKNIEMYINVSNSTSEIMDVTTNHAIFLEDSVEIAKMDKKYPLLIIKLRPKEVFKCYAFGVLGVGLSNDIWSAAANCYYSEIDENKFKFTIESQGQLDEYDILIKACSILVIKLNSIKDIINNKYDNDQSKGKKKLIIHLENEDHTIGNILNEYLQNNKNIAYSGLSKPDLLVREVVIKLLSIDQNPLKHVYETIDLIIDICNNVQDQLKKLNK
ncbi:MAG: DNA directed RNA polymerase subunit L [Homavirus sp.]|uniref:DNA directed RNA polymerase subunit L n=1 Tax=Homavirus sp. TaxID=2487769 RepID=A0A3G5A8L3_9VIRU|nr:MAG: DNA directed RNA polymerase subunit L [Homavirus sp.]